MAEPFDKEVLNVFKRWIKGEAPYHTENYGLSEDDNKHVAARFLATIDERDKHNARYRTALESIGLLFDKLERGSSDPANYKLLELRIIAHKPFREIIKYALDRGAN